MTNKITQFFLLFVVILVLVGFSVVLTSRQGALPAGPDDDEDQMASETGNQLPALVVEKSYTQDANTFRGSLMVDEPCSRLSTEVDVNEDNPEKITLAFQTQGEDKACNSAAAKKDFIIVIPSSASAKLEKVVFNGVAVVFEVRSQ